MDHPFDRRDFLTTAAGTLALLLSPRGLGAWGREPVRFDEKKREIVG
jgi:hypothetical protein